MRFTPPWRRTWLLSMLLLAASPPAAALDGDMVRSCDAGLGEPARVESALDGELEVLSWNIQKASNAGWAEDLASFAAGVDLAFIQEASLRARIPQVLPRALHSAFAQGYTSASDRTGVLTMSTAAPSGHCRLTAREPWLQTLKATGVTRYSLRGRDEPLLAINLHAVNFEFSLQNFGAQIRALGSLLDEHRGPVIVAGDLNTWSAGRQSLVDDFMREYGLGSVAFEEDLRTRAFGRALDHIYVRGMVTRAAEVIPVASSDHNPLRVTLAVQ